MQLYKFLKKEHVHFLTERNTVLLGGFEHYREIESKYEWISDKTEGLTKASFKGTYKFEPTDPDGPVRQRFSKMGFGIGLGTGARIIDPVTEFKLPNMYIFCASSDPFLPASKAMCLNAPPGHRYNACVRIADAMSFYECIRNTGDVVDPLECEIGKFFSQSTHGHCRYGYKTADPRTEEIVRPDPLLKPHSLRSQQEYRFVFLPIKNNSKTKTVTIRADFPPGLLEEIPLGF